MDLLKVPDLLWTVAVVYQWESMETFQIENNQRLTRRLAELHATLNAPPCVGVLRRKSHNLQPPQVANGRSQPTQALPEEDDRCTIA
jgi:hypothetical protein